MGNLSLEFDEFRTRSPGELQEEWLRRLGTAPPKLPSSDVMARILAWRVQEREHGGLDPDVKARLRRLAKDPNPDSERPRRVRPSLSPGTTLVREWQGATHHVRVTDSGFEYNGRGYGSLSEVARAITGTRWSGPRFFELNNISERRIAP